LGANNLTIEKYKIPFDAQLDIAKTYEDAGQQYVEGYAATTDYDDQGDIITPEALKQSEGDLLERSTVLFNHDKERPIGKVEKATGDNKGLKIKVLISKAEPDIWQKIKEGVINKFSIRGAILEANKEKVKQSGKEIWANIIKAMKLIEVSMVSVPANSEAKALSWYMSKAIEESTNNANDKENLLKEIEDYKKKIEVLDNIIKELKGYSVVNGVMQPTSRLRAYATHILGLKDCKLGQNINISASGSIKSLESDEYYGDTCLIDINKGELTEVQKTMADIKKKDGTVYTQEEIDALESKLVSTAKELETAKAADATAKAEIESAKVEAKKSLDVVVAEKSSAETKLADLQKKFDDVTKELNDAKAKQADEDVNKKVDVKWAELEGKAYKKEDSSIIKPILKKGFLSQALTPEETDSLISKKIQGSVLKLGFEAVVTKSMSKERHDEIVKYVGIKVKKQ